LPRLRAGILRKAAAAENLAPRKSAVRVFLRRMDLLSWGRWYRAGGTRQPAGNKRDCVRWMGVCAFEKRGKRRLAALETIVVDLRATEQSRDEVNAQKQVACREVCPKHRHEHIRPELARLGLELSARQSELGGYGQDVDEFCAA